MDDEVENEGKSGKKNIIIIKQKKKRKKEYALFSALLLAIKRTMNVL